jgi:hypothetical protein
VLSFDRADFENRRLKNEKLDIAIVGLLHLQDDISPELAAEVVKHIQVRGVYIASEAVKAAVADRTE